MREKIEELRKDLFDDIINLRLDLKHTGGEKLSDRLGDIEIKIHKVTNSVKEEANKLGYQKGCVDGVVLAREECAVIVEDLIVPTLFGIDYAVELKNKELKEIAKAIRDRSKQ